MTTPGSSRPQGAFTISSNFGQDYDEDTVYEGITGKTRRDLGAAVEGFDEFKLGTYNTAADLANLQGRTQRLEGVVGYAYSYLSGGLHTGNQDLFIPCDRPVGPSVGVTVADNRFTMNSRGLWVANDQLGFEPGGGLVQNNYVNVQIRIYAPDGSLFAHRISESTECSAHTRTVQMPFVVTSAGYRCEMWGWVGLIRGIKGGSGWTGLSLRRISTETE
ncbi:hypothetical protein [Rhodococcus sp. 14-2483-1-2]|uniref:hypothetical protein n=1 Tax=Rhodococcus sp. 14-2483-1-2 TaxID=2023147 RepID=UPI000B9BB620|nr:hypothetical protein [Rhodococcus sp. 14-2483-1-2]OZF28710.1 hypothetical protein CH295_20000 [Rhodococcus sp. 14-2483-1-2]